MKNFFKYRGNISRIGFILILIGFFLSAVSFLKGIQILMFIPALVIALFLYSYLEVRRLKKHIRCNLLMEREDYILSVRGPESLDFFFRVGCKKGNVIYLLKPDSNNNYLNITYDDDIELIVYLKGTFDILRSVVSVGKINQSGISQVKRSNAQDYRDSTFFFVREYESGDNLGRLDSIKSALKDIPFIKTLMNFDTSKNDRNKNQNTLKLLINSNRIISARDDSFKGNILKWLLILINFIVIYIEWESLTLNAFMFFPAILVLFLISKGRTLKKLRLLDAIILMLFLNMIFTAITMRDMTGPGSVFLTQILIFKQLFSDDRDDGFLYIFLSMFVFVAVSLFAVELWFILFFLLYLVISVFLLTSVSGYMVSDPVRGAFGTKNSNLRIMRVTSMIFLLMIFLFFVLPHGNSKGSGGTTLAPQNTENLSGFSNELNFKNIGSIKSDQSKVIVVDNLAPDESELLKKLYWRGERFYEFNGSSWIKKDLSRAYLLNAKKDLSAYKTLEITYFPKGATNIFFPFIPESTDLGDNLGNNHLRSNYFDNSIFYMATKPTKAFNIKASLNFSKDSKFSDSEAKLINFDTGAKISPETEKLFSLFWSKIDRKEYDTPSKIMNYVKNTYGFSYSVDSPSVDIKDFLYGSKKGYCEYYATVLALTLQHFGYKATIVNGYYSGEWNNLANSWIIRGKDAHSWVEVYDKNVWKVYDATPNVIDNSEIPLYKKAWDLAVSIYDYLDLKWYAYVVNYSGDVQKELINKILSFKLELSLFIAALILFAISRYLLSIYNFNKNLSYEEKLLIFIKKNTAEKFPLEIISDNDADLVDNTRAYIYKSGKLNYKDFKGLKTQWQKFFRKGK